MNKIDEPKQATTANTRNTVPKNIMVVSEKLTKAQLEEYQVLWQHYTDCKDEFLKRCSGPKYMAAVKHWETIRDMVRKEQQSAKGTGQDLTKRYSIQKRHWTMAIADACQTINSMWSNLANTLKRAIRDNSNILSDERLYLYLILQDRILWKCVIDDIPFPEDGLEEKFLDTRSKVEDSRIKYLHSYLRRKTRDKKPAPEAHSTRCMLLDDSMYSIITEADATYLEFMSSKPRKRYRVRLKSPYCYSKTGNIQLILDVEKSRIEIHKLIQTKTKPSEKTGGDVGIDKGYATLISASDDLEYGIGFGEIASKESERINKRNTNRNLFIQQVQDLKEQIAAIRDKIDRMDNITTDMSAFYSEKLPLIQQKKQLEKDLSHLEEHNVGNKIYNSQHHRRQEYMESLINKSIKEFLAASKPAVIGKEDLSFVREKTPKGKDGKRIRSKAYNRHMASWTKGTLNERIEYIAAEQEIEVIDVNAAYTSQFCPVCGAPLEKRTGKHSEKSHCPNCGEGNANTGAAKIIKERMHDPEITLYTPYPEVKIKMLARYEASRKIPDKPTE